MLKSNRLEKAEVVDSMRKLEFRIKVEQNDYCRLLIINKEGSEG